MTKIAKSQPAYTDEDAAAPTIEQQHVIHDLERKRKLVNAVELAETRYTSKNLKVLHAQFKRFDHLMMLCFCLVIAHLLQRMARCGVGKENAGWQSKSCCRLEMPIQALECLALLHQRAVPPARSGAAQNGHERRPQEGGHR